MRILKEAIDLNDLSRISVVLPSLDPDEKLVAVVDGLLEYGFTDIILVNDGSKPENLHYFTDLAAQHPEITLLTHEVNRGKGAALKLKSLVEAVLKEAGKNIAVLPVGLVNLEEHLKDMEAEYAIRATVGMKKPELPIPFIPIEEFVGGAGEDRLLDILRGRKSGGTPLALRAEEGQKSIVVRKLCEESLTKFLTYLNPAKIMDSLMEFDRVLEQELGKQFSKPIRIRIIVHCGCALERAVTRTPLRYEDDKSEVDTQKLAAIQKAAGVFENTLKLRFDADELCFMAKMI